MSVMPMSARLPEMAIASEMPKCRNIYVGPTLNLAWDESWSLSHVSMWDKLAKVHQVSIAFSICIFLLYEQVGSRCRYVDMIVIEGVDWCRLSNWLYSNHIESTPRPPEAESLERRKAGPSVIVTMNGTQYFTHVKSTCLANSLWTWWFSTRCIRQDGR